jgi:hypothetical protein
VESFLAERLVAEGFFFVAEKTDFLLRRADSWSCRRVVDLVDGVEGVVVVKGGVFPVVDWTGGVVKTVGSSTGWGLARLSVSDGFVLGWTRVEASRRRSDTACGEVTSASEFKK